LGGVQAALLAPLAQVVPLGPVATPLPFLVLDLPLVTGLMTTMAAIVLNKVRLSTDLIPSNSPGDVGTNLYIRGCRVTYLHPREVAQPEKSDFR
jgi:hypothetical protein